MGDIIRPRSIRGVDAKGTKRHPILTVRALIDSGAQRTVIPQVLADALGGHVLRTFDKVEGALRDVMSAWVKLKANDCDWRGIHPVVSDELAERSGPAADIILGQDYLQRTRAAIFLSERRDDEGVACRTDDDERSAGSHKGKPRRSAAYR